MNDRQNTKGHKECKRHEYKQNSQYLWNIIILLQKKHLSFSEACLQQMNTTILIKLTRRNIQFLEQIFCFLSLEPHDHQIYYVNIDLHHRHGISVSE